MLVYYYGSYTPDMSEQFARELELMKQLASETKESTEFRVAIWDMPDLPELFKTFANSRYPILMLYKADDKTGKRYEEKSINGNDVNLFLNQNSPKFREFSLS